MRTTLISALVFALTGIVLAATATSADAYTRTVDITFPVAGPTSYIDDYGRCRGGADCPRRHRATDVMAPYGAIVHAAMGGTIRFITGLDGNPPDYGYMIRINGDDGRTYNYIHLGRQDLGPESAYAPGLRAGVRVDRGQPIGINGCSGNASCSAPHLHFEIVDSSITDPYGSNRMNPFASLRDAERRGDLPSGFWMRFTDVRFNDVHLQDIKRLADAGVTRGCNPPTSDRFCPHDPVTRGEMAAFLSRAGSLPAAPRTGFVDVPRGSTFEADIDRIAAVGITRGCNPPTNDRFCPDALVTRAEMAAFLARADSLPAASRRGFVDVPRGSTFEADIDRIAAVGITRGCNPPTNDRYCPDAPVTRAEMASFLIRGGAADQ